MVVVSVPRFALPVYLRPTRSSRDSERSSMTRVTTRIESPTLTSSPLVAGVSMRTNGRFVSGAPGLTGATGEVPVGPPLMPLPNFGPAGGLSQLMTTKTPAAATTSREMGKRMNFKLLWIAPRLHRHVTFVDDVRRDQDQEIPLCFVPVRYTEQTTDEREVNQQGDTGLCDTNAGLREPAHHRRFTVGNEELVIDALGWKDRADVSGRELHVRILGVDLHMNLPVIRDKWRDLQHNTCLAEAHSYLGKGPSGVATGALFDRAHRRLRARREHGLAIVQRG